METSPASCAARDQLSALLDAAVDAMVLIDTRGVVTRFSRSAEQMFGYAAGEVVGRNVSVLMPQPYHGEHDGYIQRYHHTGEARIIGIGREVVARRKDGSEFPIELSVGQFVSDELSGFVGILRDISVRKQQEAELRQSTEELRLIFDHAPTAIMITDLDGSIINLNRAAADLFGYQPLDLHDVNQIDLVHPEDRERVRDELRKLIGQQGHCACELRYLRRDGEVLHATHYAATVEGDGEPLMVIGEVVDRTAVFDANREAQELRDRLTHVGRIGTLGEMVSGIAHEVNQPLTAIASYASACRRLMLGNLSNPAELLGILEKIAAQAERAGQVIRGLRALAKRADPERKRLDVNLLVREVRRLVEFEFRDHGIQLETREQSGLQAVQGDGIQIQQIVLNLLRNAMEAMNDAGKTGTVLLETLTPERDWVEIRVSDQGPGLPPSVAQRLFEPFFTTKQQGMGLGLSICQSIARAHGGELSYFLNEHHGATFALRLPATDDGDSP